MVFLPKTVNNFREDVVEIKPLFRRKSAMKADMLETIQNPK